ncbi:alpha/beta fold hydrolase [Chryseobacterium daecheongense]|uniref:Alpha/beta fold hydrolase n=1 Tax=Chryseobacterium daecheongense TaxID=192389 RepID=A0A3N0W6N7_9FLAO|nr:alpha/beta fold hydrolase [Chryseobacterium daecheongense]ROI00726.1 alpha/beta fold hydrolase [Chryseobacterium daecheongense]TDX94279.1 pimeloyl-ACP methyl ester carboxylesterase [Chryseobacterium daecheongense]
MKNFIALFLLLSGIYGYAQVISGTVFSSEENKPIPYVKIGVEKETSGTISDENGQFSIDLSQADKTHKIRIEVAGFENYTTSVLDFIKNNDQKIFLKEKVKNIQEVKLTPKKFVDKNWGVNTKTKHVLYSVNPELRREDFLGETALEFNASKRSKIKNINLNVASYQSDRPVVMRYVIYSEKNGFPDQNILDEEITVKLTEDMIKSGTFVLDVNDRNIWVQGKFFIGIQFLKEFEGKVTISAALFRTGFIRKFYGNWEKMTLAAPAINIDVKVDKNGKNIKDEMEEDQHEKLSMLTPDIAQYNEESENSVYGKNDSAGKVLELKDAELYYEVYGEGQPLVLLHGNGGSIKEFYKQIPELSKHFKIIALDTRAQGKSKDLIQNNLTYTIFADDLKSLMDHLGLHKVNIMGWSDGGNTGLEFSLKYPENLNKLIIIGANAFPEGVEKSLLNNFKLKAQVLKLENTPDKIKEARLLTLMLHEPDINKKALNKITSPVFVIAGENDVIKKEHTEMLAKELRNSKLKIYTNASHYVPFEVADELNRDVIDFLKN